MAWKTNNHQVPLEKVIAKKACSAILAHYLIVGIFMYFVLTLEGTVTQITICDGTADIENGYSIMAVIMSCYYGMIIICGALADIAMIIFLREKANNPEPTPAQLIPWKSGGSTHYNHKVVDVLVQFLR